MLKSTMGEEWKKFSSCGLDNVTDYVDQRSNRLVLLTKEEELAVECYTLWQLDRGMPLQTRQLKALMREIYLKAIERGEKRQPISYESGPSNDYMRDFYSCHPNLSLRSGETVDMGRINMVNQYFKLLKETINCGILELEEGEVIQSSIKNEHTYLADETGCLLDERVQHTSMYVKLMTKVMRQLMLGVCGNGEVLKPLVILEKSFPLIGEDESQHLPDNILLSKTENGSMDQWRKNYFVIGLNVLFWSIRSVLILMENHFFWWTIMAPDLVLKQFIFVQKIIWKCYVTLVILPMYYRVQMF